MLRCPKYAHMHFNPGYYIQCAMISMSSQQALGSLTRQASSEGLPRLGWPVGMTLGILSYVK